MERAAAVERQQLHAVKPRHHDIAEHQIRLVTGDCLERLRLNLYLRVTILPDARFERKGDDLYTTVPVELTTMVLGGEVRVPTMTGDVVMTIPAGTRK